MLKNILSIKIIILLIIIIAVLMISSSAFAQSGIYYAESNFKNGITNYQIPCPSKLSPNDLYDFYMKNFIYLSEAEAIKKFKKKEIWGYSDCKGFDWKIDNNIHYKIVENGAMVIYLVDYPVNSSFQDFQMGVKASFYFSKDVSSKILQLSQPILIGEYNDNPEFLKSLKEYLGSSNGCIHCYDITGKSYMISKLLRKSLDN